LARQKGDENVAQDALAQRQLCQEMAQVLQAQLGRQRELVTKFQKDLVTLETRSAQVSEKINAILGNR
jgi:phage shock protein A